VNPDAYLEMADTEERHWWFTGRRAVLRALIERLGLPRHARILEIGAGTGGNLRMLSVFGSVSAVEIDDTARQIAAQKTHGAFDLRAGSCPANLPFTHERFDLICLFDVLEHIDDDAGALASAKRLLAADGYILLTVPAYQWLWSSHDDFMHHKRRYAAAQLRTAIARAQLRLQRMSYYNMLLFPLAAVVRLRERLLGSPHHGRRVPAAALNRCLAQVFGAERLLLERMNLPFGVSLLAIARG
jgi:SAM-dependent methyltransferase